MRAPLLVACCPLFAGCTATLLYEPRILVSPYLAVHRLRGDVAVQSDPGGGAPLQQNPAEPLRTFGQEHHREDVGVRADVGDGFGGLRIEYYRLDMNTTQAGTLAADWGALLENDTVLAKAEMDELRVGYLEPLFETRTNLRDRPLGFRFAAGAVLAHRDMILRARTTDGERRQTLQLEGDVAAAAVRGRVTWQNVAFDLDYAICPDLSLGGDYDGVQQDLELRLGYTLPMRDVTFFAGYRYSELEANGNAGRLGYDADLVIDGYQFGMTVSF
ncbi:MAG: hypothetical protein FJ265_04115 [Planctomycetes bacterium]|nr:hypothetical protein [Planctomycetota bacterium]